MRGEKIAGIPFVDIFPIISASPVDGCSKYCEKRGDIVKERMMDLIDETKSKLAEIEQLVSVLEGEKALEAIMGGTNPTPGNPPPDNG